MNTPHPRRPRKSRLDAQRGFITEKWLEDASLLTISQELNAAGCKTSYENLRKWVKREVQGNRLPPRVASTVGRPAGELPFTGSLGILPPASTLASTLIAIPSLLLWVFKTPSIPFTAVETVLKELNIPANSDGEPDFAAYAKAIGPQRVSAFGDGDYFLLAACLLDWKKYEEPDAYWVSATLCAAARIKQEMIVASHAS
jgi:hypothetical protein